MEGKHVVIKAPKHSGSVYFNYKGTFSIVLLGLVDANYKFIYVGCNGRISDGGVYQNCNLSRAINEILLNWPDSRPLPGREKDVPYVIIADDAFALSSNLMKPFPFRNQPGPNRVYNYRLSRARNVVENAFGIIASRFRILRKPIELCPEKARGIVKTICVLHNFLMTNNSRRIYAPPGVFDSNIEGVITPGTWREHDVGMNSLPPLRHNVGCRNGKEVREELRDYFVSPEGELAWQYKYI